MCIFSGAVDHVSGTQIFARALEDEQQALVYQMQVGLRQEVAMVLPLPVPPGSADDAVRFVDLSGCRTFFTDLARAFPSPFQGRAAAPPSFGSPKLVVHDVGDFEASFVPGARDFARLDPRFRLPSDVLAAFPAYADWGFAVFKLKADSSFLAGLRRKPKTIHPMALAFPRRDGGALFFPTVHVHDGRVAPRAAFDHTLYTQVDGALDHLLPWDRSATPVGPLRLGEVIDASRCGGLVDPDAPGRRETLFGQLPNADQWLRVPGGVGLDDLVFSETLFAASLQARAAFIASDEPPWRGWRKSALERLPALCRGVRSGLRDWVAKNEKTARLAPLASAPAPHFMNGMQLWRGTSHMDGSPGASEGAGHVVFRPYTDRVEAQTITLGFGRLPSQDEAVAIHRSLCGLLDQATRG